MNSILSKIKSYFVTEPVDEVTLFFPQAETDIVSFDLQVSKNPEDDLKSLYRLFMVFFPYTENGVDMTPSFIYATPVMVDSYAKMADKIKQIRDTGVIPSSMGIKVEGTVMDENGKFLYNIDWRDFPHAIDIKPE